MQKVEEQEKSKEGREEKDDEEKSGRVENGIT